MPSRRPSRRPGLITIIGVVMAIVASAVALQGMPLVPGSSVPQAKAIDYCDLIGQPEDCDSGDLTSLYVLTNGQMSPPPDYAPGGTELRLGVYTNVAGLFAHVTVSGTCRVISLEEDPSVDNPAGAVVEMARSGDCRIDATAHKGSVTLTENWTIRSYTFSQTLSWDDTLLYGGLAPGDHASIVVKSTSDAPTNVTATGTCSVEFVRRLATNRREFVVTGGSLAGPCDLTATQAATITFDEAIPITRRFSVYTPDTMLLWEPGYEPPTVMSYPSAPLTIGVTNNAGGGDVDFTASGSCTATRIAGPRFSLTMTSTGDCNVSATALVIVLRADGTLYMPLIHDSFPVVAGNHTPAAAFTLQQSSPLAPATVSVDATISSDPDSDALTASWDFGNGSTATGTTASTSYPAAGSYTIELTVTDPAGASATTTRTVDVAAAPPVDTTPPIIEPVVTGSTGDGGWYTGDVSVSWTYSDAQSTISQTSGCTPTSVTTDTAGVTFTCSATSAGGTAEQSVTIKRDATAPSLAPEVTPNPVNVGGSATAVPHATDLGSGVASSSCGQVDTSAVGASSVSCTATDVAGNVATLAANFTVTDSSGPTVTPTVTGTLGTNGWYTSDVVVSWAVGDPDSTISATTGCDPATQSTDTAGTTFTCSATSAGGTTTQSVVVKRDATKPTLAPSVTPNPVVFRRTATAAARPADSTSGIASESCGPVATGTLGAASVTCTATDAAGNTATGPAAYSVIYAWGGFLGPVDVPPTVNRMPAGRAVPVTFTLGGDFSLRIFATAPSSRQVACPARWVNRDIVEVTNSASVSSLSYVRTTRRYTYTWRTDARWRGTCRELTIVLADGTSHSAVFQFT